MADPEHLEVFNKRAAAEQEAIIDLDKTNEQLLADIHEELTNETRPAGFNLIHAQKRLASAMVRTAISNDRSTKVLLRLTWVLVFLTVVLVILTVVMLLKM
jgi:hypothetical protein